jgi:hypothetical protein
MGPNATEKGRGTEDSDGKKEERTNENEAATE